MPQNYSLNGIHVSKEEYEKARGINQTSPVAPKEEPKKEETKTVSKETKSKSKTKGK